GLSIGFQTEARGDYSLAMGRGSLASGLYRALLGVSSVASGPSSIALGHRVQASGNHSLALGVSTKAESLSSTALGRFNVGGGDPSRWFGTDPLLEVGNGASFAERRNALTILKNGNVGIGTATPAALLEVAGAAAKPGGGAWSVASDARLKKD